MPEASTGRDASVKQTVHHSESWESHIILNFKRNLWTTVHEKHSLVPDAESVWNFLNKRVFFNWLWVLAPVADVDVDSAGQCSEFSGPVNRQRHWVWLETSCFSLISSLLSPGLLFPRQWLHRVPLPQKETPLCCQCWLETVLLKLTPFAIWHKVTSASLRITVGNTEPVVSC